MPAQRETDVTSTKRLMRLALVSPFLIYLFIACLYFGPSHFSQIKDTLFTPSADPELIVWFLNWWPFAIAHHINPFLSKYIWFPQGFNMAWATSIPSAALMMTPVTMAWGANASFNILALLALPLSATTCFYLVHRLTRSFFPSLLSGYIFGFSSYELAQLHYHTNLYLTFLVPLAVLLFILRTQQSISKTLFISLMALLVVVQFGLSKEIFATFSLFSVIALIVFYMFSDKGQRSLLVRASHDTLVSLIISIFLLGPYIYYLAIGLKHVPTAINSPGDYSSDLLNYIIPTPISRLGRYLFSNIAQHFAGIHGERDAYMGVPLLLIAFAYLLKSWGHRLTKAIYVILGVLVLFSLGPYLHVNGINTRIPLPWYFGARIPLITSALPARFPLYVALVLAVIVGLWLSQESHKRITTVKYAAVLIAILFILPNTGIYSWKQVNVPVLFKKGVISRYIPANANILYLPYGELGSSGYYQYASGMAFTQSGGYVGFTPISFSKSQVAQSLYSGRVGRTFDSHLVAFCSENRIERIIYRPGTNKALVFAISELKWPTLTIGRSTVVSVPSSRLATPF